MLWNWLPTGANRRCCRRTRLCRQRSAVIWLMIRTPSPLSLQADCYLDSEPPNGGVWKLTVSSYKGVTTPDLLAPVLTGQSIPAGAGGPGEKSNWDGTARAG